MNYEYNIWERNLGYHPHVHFLVPAGGLSADTWTSEGVVHCQPVGRGQAILKYLAPYIFRVAIGNRRIIRVTNGKVTFCYRASDRGQFRTNTLNGRLIGDCLSWLSLDTSSKFFLQPKPFIKQQRHLPRAIAN